MRSAILLLLAVLSCLPGRAGAAEASPVWHKSCETPKGEALQCAAEQFAFAEPGDRPVLRIRFERQPEGRAKLTALAPLGISLRGGLELVVDHAAPIKLPFERCTAQGCEVSAILDPAALEKFVTGTILTLRYAPTDALSASAPIKLEGLAASLESLSH